MKCFICSTEFNVFPCPTCERNRLLKEQNRLSEEQNRILERNASQIRAEQEKQTRIMREQSQQQDNEQLKNLNVMIAENTIRMGEFNALIPFHVYSEFILEPTVNPLIECSSFLYYLLPKNIKLPPPFLRQVEEIIINVYMADLNEVIDFLNKNNRVVDWEALNIYDRPIYKHWETYFNINDIKQTLDNHNKDYVIISTINKVMSIFPIKIISNVNSLRSVDGKTTHIGDFRYLMFLKDNVEAEQIAYAFSETSKRFTSLKNLVAETISKTSKSKLKLIDLKYKVWFDEKSLLSRLISILPGLVVFPVMIKLSQLFGFSSNIVFGAIISLISTLLSFFSRAVFRIVTGILSFLFFIWLFKDLIDNYVINFPISAMLGFAIGFLSIRLFNITDDIKFIEKKIKEKNILKGENFEKEMLSKIIERINNFINSKSNVKDDNTLLISKE